MKSIRVRLQENDVERNFMRLKRHEERNVTASETRNMRDDVKVVSLSLSLLNLSSSLDVYFPCSSFFQQQDLQSLLVSVTGHEVKQSLVSLLFDIIICSFKENHKRLLEVYHKKRDEVHS